MTTIKPLQHFIYFWICAGKMYVIFEVDAMDAIFADTYFELAYGFSPAQQPYLHCLVGS